MHLWPKLGETPFTDFCDMVFARLSGRTDTLTDGNTRKIMPPTPKFFGSRGRKRQSVEWRLGFKCNEKRTGTGFSFPLCFYGRKLRPPWILIEAPDTNVFLLKICAQSLAFWMLKCDRCMSPKLEFHIDFVKQQLLVWTIMNLWLPCMFTIHLSVLPVSLFVRVLITEMSGRWLD